jgi:hypothetical protein
MTAKPHQSWWPDSGVEVCLNCGQDWPCDAAALSAQLAEQRSINAALTDHLEHCLNHLEPAFAAAFCDDLAAARTLLDDLSAAATLHDEQVRKEERDRVLDVERIAVWLHANNAGCKFMLGDPEGEANCRETWHLNDAAALRTALSEEGAE